eukprot:8570579-Alexandrium_andersonii.AAC.1
MQKQTVRWPAWPPETIRSGTWRGPGGGKGATGGAGCSNEGGGAGKPSCTSKTTSACIISLKALALARIAAAVTISARHTVCTDTSSNTADPKSLAEQFPMLRRMPRARQPFGVNLTLSLIHI